MLQSMNNFFYANGNWRYTVAVLVLVLAAYFVPKLRTFFKAVGESKKREKKADCKK